MATSNQGSNTLLNVVSLLVLLPVVLILAVRFGPFEYRVRALTTWMYLSGKGEGCDLERAWNPIELDVPKARARLDGKVRQLDSEGPFEVWETPSGKWWTPPSTPVMLLLIEQEIDVYSASDGGVEPGDVVIDCGANVGAYSRHALDSGASLVVAVEPSPMNVASLEKNFAKEIGEGRLVVVPKAVWNEPGTMMLQTFEHSVLDTLVMPDRVEGRGKVKTEVEVELVTIDSIVAELGLERLDVLKMDIEGAERHALRGAFDTIRRFKPTLPIAAENLPDDISVVPEVVREAVPEYEMSTGRCRIIDDEFLRPEAMVFSLPGA